jgi:predicted PolB exonuclease-like 3'-5' exonuclease
MLVCSPEKDGTHLCQWTFAAPAFSPILKQVIELCIERILSIKKIDDNFVHFLTGPGAFTDGIEKYFILNNIQTFSNKNEYVVYKNTKMICFSSTVFHDRMITHLFAGSDRDGWKNQRKRMVI